MNAPRADLHAIHAAELRTMCVRIKDTLDAAIARGRTAPRVGADPAAAEAAGLPSLLAAIAARFGLSAFEAGLLALAMAVEIDPAVAEAVRRLQPGGDPRPSFGLGFAVLGAPHWSALTPERPLLRWGLVRAEPAALLIDAPLSIDARVLHALMGAGSADAALELHGRRCGAPRRIAAAQEAVAMRLAAALEEGPAQLVGGDPEDRDAIVLHAAAAGGRPVWRFAEAVPHEAAARLRLARLIERECVLTSMVPLLDAAADPAASALALALDAPFVLSTPEPRRGFDRPVPCIEAPRLDFDARRSLWRAAADGAGASDADLDRLAYEFPLGAHAIAEIGALGGTARELRDGAKRRVRVALDGLAIRRRPRAAWSDLALRPGQRGALMAIVRRVRLQAAVVERWGYGRATGRGVGVSALFAGPSGAGKTLAADVVAAELDLDILHVDLSQIVSKWLGETEKNLERVFAIAELGGTALLFDEADALFGKRSEVKDGRDRYANLEVSFLLQRLEAFRGLAILTTNQQTALDEAFLRRLSVVVHFPFPDAAARQDIWERIHPPEAPCEAQDSGRLAEIVASGGDIRNIAVGAAYVAAARGEAARITMADLFEAADVELAKLNRSRGGARKREGRP